MKEFAYNEILIKSDLAEKILADQYQIYGKATPLPGESDFNTDKYNLSLGFKYPEGTYLQIYTPEHRQSIAIEPMTCIANSFNNKIGFTELTPGKTDTWRIDLFYLTKS